MVLGSAKTLSVATSSETCANLRYGRAVQWTADTIRRRRDELGLTQQQLAERLGVSLRTVTAWEAGESQPRRVADLTRVLGEPRRERPRPVDLSALNNAQLITLMAQVTAEVGYRLDVHGDRQRRGRRLTGDPLVDYPGGAIITADDMPDVDVTVVDESFRRDRLEG